MGLKYVKRGFTVLFALAPPLLFIALGSFGALELLNLYQQGELQRLWNVALQTELTFDLVRPIECTRQDDPGHDDDTAAFAQITVVGCISLVAVALLSYFLLGSRPVYMLDFHVHRAPERCVNEGLGLENAWKGVEFASPCSSMHSTRMPLPAPFDSWAAPTTRFLAGSRNCKVLRTHTGLPACHAAGSCHLRGIK